MMNINNKADYSEEKMTLEEKLKSMKNYDKWLYLLENFDELKYVESYVTEWWYEFPKLTKDKLFDRLEIMFAEKQLKNGYFHNFDILLPVLVEKDQNKKLHKFFEFFLSFPDSKDWENNVYNMFSAVEFEFNYLYEFLPQSEIVSNILTCIWELEEDWARVYEKDWVEMILSFWWQMRKIIFELNKIANPNIIDYWNIFRIYMLTRKEWNDKKWEYYN